MMAMSSSGFRSVFTSTSTPRVLKISTAAALSLSLIRTFGLDTETPARQKSGPASYRSPRRTSSWGNLAEAPLQRDDGDGQPNQAKGEEIRLREGLMEAKNRK